MNQYAWKLDLPVLFGGTFISDFNTTCKVVYGINEFYVYVTGHRDEFPYNKTNWMH
jgi:hypothetical protein